MLNACMMIHAMKIMKKSKEKAPEKPIAPWERPQCTGTEGESLRGATPVHGARYECTLSMG